MKPTPSEADVLASDGSCLAEQRMSRSFRAWPAAKQCSGGGHQLDQSPNPGSHASAALGCDELPLEPNHADGRLR